MIVRFLILPAAMKKVTDDYGIWMIISFTYSIFWTKNKYKLIGEGVCPIPKSTFSK